MKLAALDQEIPKLVFDDRKLQNVASTYPVNRSRFIFEWVDVKRVRAVLDIAFCGCFLAFWLCHLKKQGAGET